MSFSFTPEQDELRSAVRRFFGQRSSSADVRSRIESETPGDADVWRLMAEQLGLQGLAIPEEFGGHGFSSVELGIVLEEAGRALLVSPYFATVALAGQTLVAAAADAAKREYLPKIASGELTATLAVVGDSGAWDLTRTEVHAESGLLTGVSTFVVDGDTADVVFVVARSADGIGLYAVAGDAVGLSRTRLDALDLTRRLGRLEFNNTPGTLVTPAGDATVALAHALDLVCTAVAIEQVGGAQRCLDMSVEYAKVRVQFGRPIGSFQAIKHKCADMLIDVESARSAAYYASGIAADGPVEELAIAAALAKAYCSEAFIHAAKENVQIHGGIGFTWEHDAHLYLRRAKSSELLFGEPDRHRQRLAELVGI